MQVTDLIFKYMVREGRKPSAEKQEHQHWEESLVRMQGPRLCPDTAMAKEVPLEWPPPLQVSQLTQL